MTYQIYPPASTVSGDPASQTVPAIAAGTYTFTTTMAAGSYEITTDTVQSSFTLILESADGYRYSGTIRGGKGYIVAASPVTKMVVPSGLTYPVNINARLGASTLIAAPTGTSITFTAGNLATVAWTAPSGATDIVAYFRDGTNTSMATTTSPKTSVSIGGATNATTAYAIIVAKDAKGNIGTGVETASSNTPNIPISGGTVSTYTSGATTYLVNTFTSSGTLTVAATPNIDYLVVAGGGAGAVGGGGGGGYLTGTVTSAANGSFTVTVGAGGAGKNGNLPASYTTNLQGNQGSNSSIAFGTAITSVGGGGGGMISPVNQTYSDYQAGGNGGSGGGGGTNYNSGGSANGGTATSGQGNAGGNGLINASTGWGTAAGGGGAGAAGGNRVSNTQGGNGGNGSQSSINGTATYYAGGGGGGAGGSGTLTQGTAGLGGATAGWPRASGNNAPSATANTGGGAGGSGSTISPGYGYTGSGGSGIVIVRVAL